jgi:hypothetical protein
MYTMMDNRVVKIAVRNTYVPPVFEDLITFERSQRTASIHAIAEAKLKPATTELRD